MVKKLKNIVNNMFKIVRFKINTINDPVECGRVGCDYFVEGKCRIGFSYCDSLKKNKD